MKNWTDVTINDYNLQWFTYHHFNSVSTLNFWKFDEDIRFQAYNKI